MRELHWLYSLKQNIFNLQTFNFLSSFLLPFLPINITYMVSGVHVYIFQTEV